ncbi:hypothetical protein EV356DRAFT_513422 [Viridothelium virens]|uniref:Uncharacterized protein n=1 Tax=Viridothelium virens TaxID=1048519 RepID=A0A6A6GRU5_VIRVR|nr:hypothetical protein EV356DRAFT_513422 [Viridothelium virens]
MSSKSTYQARPTMAVSSVTKCVNVDVNLRPELINIGYPDGDVQKITLFSDPKNIKSGSQSRSTLCARCNDDSKINCRACRDLSTNSLWGVQEILRCDGPEAEKLYVSWDDSPIPESRLFPAGKVIWALWDNVEWPVKSVGAGWRKNGVNWYRVSWYDSWVNRKDVFQSEDD